MIVGDEDGVSADQCQQLVDPEPLSNDNIHNIMLGYLSSTQVDRQRLVKVCRVLRHSGSLPRHEEDHLHSE